MLTNLLEIRRLSIAFPQDGTEFLAVDSVSFDIRKGRSLGIIGESGSGKSVTALALMGLLPGPPAMIRADKMVYFDNEGKETSLLHASSGQMRRIRGNRISMIFQEPMTSLNPVTRCGNQVVEAIRAHQPLSFKEAKAKTIELFRDVRLPRLEEMFRSYPHELSGGQKQRVMIAMAIASGPDLLIADEPTTALDASVQQSIISLMKDLQAKYGMAILFITHDLGVAREIADDILVMNKGRIVESGPVENIFSNPQEPYTRGLIACRPAGDVALRRLPTISDFTSASKENSTEKLFRSLKRNDEDYRIRLDKIYKSKPLVRTANLETWFKSRKKAKGRAIFIKAVNNVSIEVYPGEVFGLVGESGCGKTTLGRTILRLIGPHKGNIQFDGSDITVLQGEKLRRLRKDIQIIFQDPYSSLNPRLKAGSAIMEPMKVHGIGFNRNERKEKAMQLLEKVGLERQHFYRYPHEFSGGQRQRICIARALAVEPKFIVCDESVSALDVSVQAQVLNLLADLKEEFGLTYIFISHDLAVVKFISNRIGVMKEGKITELQE